VNFEQLAAGVLNAAVDVILLDTTFWGGIRECVKAAGCAKHSSSASRAFVGRLRFGLTMLHLGAVIPT
jgi:glucarate dehydratase